MRNQTPMSLISVPRKVTMAFAVGACVFIAVTAMGFYGLARYQQTVEAGQIRFYATLERVTEGTMPESLMAMAEEMTAERAKIFHLTSQTFLMGCVIGLIVFILVGLLVSRHVMAELTNKPKPADTAVQPPSQATLKADAYGQKPPPSITPGDTRRFSALALVMVVPVLLLVILSYYSMTNLEGMVQHATLEWKQGGETTPAERAQIFDNVIRSITSAKLVVVAAGLMAIILSVLMAFFVQRTAQARTAPMSDHT